MKSIIEIFSNRVFDLYWKRVAAFKSEEIIEIDRFVQELYKILGGSTNQKLVEIPITQRIES